MTTLTDFQFELDGYVFGLGCPVEVEQNGFGPSGMSWKTGDVDFGDTTFFGRDYISPGAWSFSMFVNSDSEAGALAAYGALKRTWRGRDVARTPGAAQVLRYALGGRTRRIYGRSRRLTPATNNLLLFGRLDVEADFKLSDDRVYSDAEQSAIAQLSPSVEGGFDVPFEVPLDTLSASTDAEPGNFTIGGDAPTPLWITFHGPCESPKLTVGGQTIALPGVLIESGTSVTADARPWVRATLRSDGAPLGTLSRSTNLAGLELEPGGYEAVYTATDPTGTSYATVSWRDAHDGI